MSAHLKKLQQFPRTAPVTQGDIFDPCRDVFTGFSCSTPTSSPGDIHRSRRSAAPAAYLDNVRSNPPWSAQIVSGRNATHIQ